MNDESDSSKRARVSSVTNPYLKTTPPVQQTLPETSDGTSSIGVASLPVAAAAPPQQQQQDETSTRKPASVETLPANNNEKQTFGEKEPAVERLPSRNVSFGSAEILTVAELQKHAASFVNHSVRITGAVHCRHVTSDGNVCLVLKDPSIKQQPKMAPKSILKTPRGGGLKRRLSGSSTLRFVNRKRPLSSLKKQPAINPVETIVNSLTTSSDQQQSTVLVYAVSKQMPCVQDGAAVGDLIMVIGDVRKSPVPASLETIVETWNTKANTTNTFVHARILRNVNGTDMRLHDEALRMRRQHMLLATTTSNESNPSAETLRPGCGPPPYKDGTVDHGEMNV